jgi:hypothetical protein
LGTGGSIYRVSAIREAGGFDVNVCGVGEDMIAENRVRKSGWFLFLGSPAFFYERRRKSLASLLHEGFWHGCGGYDVFRKNNSRLGLFKMTPLAGFVIGAWYSTKAYRALKQKAVFLLPIYYVIKRTVWCLGFIKNQMKN